RQSEFGKIQIELREGRSAGQTSPRERFFALIIFSHQIAAQFQRAAGTAGDDEFGLSRRRVLRSPHVRQNNLEDFGQVRVGECRFHRGGKFVVREIDARRHDLRRLSEQARSRERNVELFVFGATDKFERTGRTSIDLYVAAAAVKTDLVTRGVGRNSFRGVFERGRAGKLWQVGPIRKRFQSPQLYTITAGG